MSGSARLDLPFLSVGQAQKEFVHNEALQTLDLLVAPAVHEAPRFDPPPSPAVGSCYLVGASPIGDWAGKPHCVAAYTSGGWRFVAPTEGMTAYVLADELWATYRAGDWELGAVRGSSVILDGLQVVGARSPAIASATGGTTVDSEARATLDQVLQALRQHGLIEM